MDEFNREINSIVPEIRISKYCINKRIRYYFIKNLNKAVLQG